MSFELLRPFLRPIEPLLLDDEVNEIMGNPNATWYAEREGKMLPQPNVSFEPGSLRTGLEVIANNLGKRLDEDNPIIEARLSMHNQTDAAKNLREAAQVYKVDMDEITKQVKQESAAKEKAKIEKKAAPNSPAKPRQQTAKKSAA